MQRLAMLLGTLALTATVLPAQEKSQPPAPPAAVSTDMLFFKGENAQLPDSAKSVLESRLPAIRQDAAMRIVILDYGSSKDSMLVFTRLYAIRGTCCQATAGSCGGNGDAPMSSRWSTPGWRWPRSLPRS